MRTASMVPKTRIHVKSLFTAVVAISLELTLPAQAIAEKITHDQVSVDEVKEMAVDVAKRLSPLFDVDATVRVVPRPEPTPMGSFVSRYGECVIIVNTNPAAWNRWDDIFMHMSLEKSEFLEFAAYHEAAHCFNKLGPGAFHLDELPPGRESELFSDIFALAMMGAEREDFEIERLVVEVIKMRRGMAGFFNSSHSTHQGLMQLQDDLVHNSPIHKNVFLLAAFAVDLMAKLGHVHSFYASVQPKSL